MLLELDPANQNLSHKDQTKLEKQNEQALTHLQNKLCRVCQLPSQNYVKRHRSCTVQRMIEKLERDRDEIDLNLNVALGVTHVSEYETQLQNIRDQVEYQYDLDMTIKGITLDIKHLEGQLRRLSEEERNLWKISYNERERSENHRKNCLTLEVLERNRNLSKMKEGEITAENYRLKSIITTMIHDRNRFNKFWNQMVSQLYENRRFLVDMIERAILAFNQSEDLVHRIRNSKDKAEQDKVMHVRDMTQMKRKLDKDRNYHEFLSAKGFNREMCSLNEREVRRRVMVEQELTGNLKISHKVIDKVRENFDAGESSPLKRPGVESLSIKTVSQVESLGDLKDILAEYIKNEKLYFSNFKYVQNVTYSCEFLSQLMLDFEKNLSKKRNSSSKAMTQTSLNFKDTYTALTKAKTKTSEKYKTWEMNESYLKALLISIQEICNVVGCDTRFMKTLLGDHTKVTLFNIKLFLYSLEKQVNSILAYIYYNDTQSGAMKVNLTNKKASLIDVTKIVTKHQCSECAERTNVKVYDETIVRPMSPKTVKRFLSENVVESDMQYRLHTLSECRLPRSRVLVNKRYV